MIEPYHLFARLLLILGLKAPGLLWFSPLPATFGAVPKPEAATDITREGFEHLARQRFPEALQAFRGLSNGDAGPAQARLGLALALLGAPPLTPGKIDEAAALLDEVAAGDSDLAVAARFQSLRFAQYFGSSPNLVALRDGYLALFTEYPFHEYGQRAALSAALLELYALPGPDHGKVIDHWERAAGKLGPLASTLHLLLATASADLLRDDRRAVHHLRQVESAGTVSGRVLKQVRVKLIGAYTALGEPKEAEPYYQRLAEDYPHDVILPVLRRAIDDAAEGAPRGPIAP